MANTSISIGRVEADKEGTKPPKFSIENILIFGMVMGIILAVGGFWNLSSLLWNRVKYSTGSLWANRQPIYHIEVDELYTVEMMKDRLLSNFTVFNIGIILLIIISIFFVYKTLVRKIWNEKSKKLTIGCLASSALMCFLSFWLFMSISVIASLSPIPGETEGGFSWIRIDLAGFSEVIEILNLIYMGIFIILLMTSIIVLIMKKERKEEVRNEKFSISHLFGSIIQNIPFYAILIVYLIFTIFPVYLVIQVSLSSVSDITSGDLPSNPLYNFILNYSSVMFAVSVDEPSFLGAFTNSIFIGFGTGILGLAVAVSAAYALARFKFRGNKFLSFLILSTQMFPGIILLLPQFVIWTRLGLIDNLGGILLASAAGSTAYCVWMMRGYFETIPLDIEEAATIDGSSRIGNFTQIAFPLARAGLVAVLIFTFISAWQDFVLARTFLRDVNNLTLPLLAENFENSAVLDQSPYFELLAPYSILVALPVVIFFIFRQKDIAAGAVAGSVK